MKRWYFCSTANLGQLNRLVREHHAVDVPGGEFVAVHFNGPSEMQAFESFAGVTPLGHVAMNKTLPVAAATALASYNVVSTDGLRDALVKVLGMTKMYQLTLDEF